MEEGIHLTVDLQCGDIFQLFALVSSGERSISPCVPKEGVGEADDLRNLKCKADVDENYTVDGAKKLKSLADGELVFRQEKGFPGITVSVCQTTLSTVDALNFFTDGDMSADELPADARASHKKISCSPLHGRTSEIPTFNSIMPMVKWSNLSNWEAIEGYMNCLMLKCSEESQMSLFNSEFFRTVYAAIQRGGDQGLSMEEIAIVASISGKIYVSELLMYYGLQGKY